VNSSLLNQKRGNREGGIVRFSVRADIKLTERSDFCGSPIGILSGLLLFRI
jgi:hypothetical protein